jgi:hypothetical protein
MDDKVDPLVVAKAMFWPRMLSTIIVMGDWAAESMLIAVYWVRDEFALESIGRMYRESVE